jgi:DNA topoisomerase-1
MSKYLVIVESPTKIKTLKKFLGKDFSFESSVGHIRDLPEKRYGIEMGPPLRCEYEVLAPKKEVVKKLIKASKEASLVYLCPDPDREGEAIAWHIRQLLPKEVKTQRVTFNSITSQEVQQALKHPRDIDLSLVDAQQARRVLDRIVGYTVSPILAQRVQMGRRIPGQGSLSAGRVQSVALKLVVDREKEIEAFKSQEYWNLTVLLKSQQEVSFKASLYSADGLRIEKEPKEGGLQIDQASKAQQLKDRLEKAHYKVDAIERKEKRRFPVAPFTTSTLQQEASRHFGFSAQRTMSVAQELYEGMDLGSEGAEGLITYMRTDSVRIAPEAQQAVRRYIQEQYGIDLLEPSIRQFTSSKTAQEAHEAIRPTNLEHPPEKIQSYLTADQFKLYSLIWKRFVATQMKPAVYDTVQVQIETDNKLCLRASGSQIKFRGFLSVYEEKRDEEDEDESKLLPDLSVGDKLEKLAVEAAQAFTQPPARYTEASLVKALEQSGIGRPSTYAAIMNKIQSREYTVKEKGRLKPTPLGKVTTQLLEVSFENIMNTQFTALMEDELEQVARGEMKWDDLVWEFWRAFSPKLDLAKQEAHVPKVMTDKLCPKCGKPLQKIWAGREYFYGCSAYPECDFKTSEQQLDFDPMAHNPDFDWQQSCPKCASAMKVRFGPYGVFLGCTQYPECKGIVNVPKAGETGLGLTNTACPATGCDGKLTARKSRFGKIFYSCSNYPECDVIGNEIDEVLAKFEGHPKTAYKPRAKSSKTGSKTKEKASKASSKKTTKSAAKTKSSASDKPKAKKSSPGTLMQPSETLAAIIGTESVSRPQVVQKLWAYIKAHDLQDSSDKRYVLCDPKLKKLLDEDRVHMTQIAAKLSPHLQKA